MQYCVNNQHTVKKKPNSKTQYTAYYGHKAPRNTHSHNHNDMANKNNQDEYTTPELMIKTMPNTMRNVQKQIY